MALLLLLFTGSAASGRVGIERFPYQKSIKPPAVTSRKVASCILDSDIYAATDLRYANVRIISEDGTEVPFLIRQRVHMVTQVVELPVSSKIVSFRPLEDNRVEVIVERDKRSGVPAIVELHAQQRDYEKLVSVYGSSNQTRWRELVENQPIFDYSSYVDVRNNRIEIPARDYRYYKIEISNFTEKRTGRQVELTTETRGDIRFSEIERKTMRTEHIRIDRIELREKKSIKGRDHTFRKAYVTGDIDIETDDKKQTSTWTFGTDRQPLVSLSFETGSENFSRRFVAAGGSASGKPKWRRLATATLYSLNLGAIRRDQVTMSLPAPSRYEQYRITIHNQDNAPLDVSGVIATGEVYEAVFFPGDPGRYTMLYGGQGIEAPRYDIRSVLQSVPTVDADLWSLGDEEENPQHKPGLHWGGLKTRVFFVAAMALMIGLLLFLIVKSAGKVGQFQ